jgi:hypothetical protein
MLPLAAQLKFLSQLALLRLLAGNQSVEAVPAVNRSTGPDHYVAGLIPPLDAACSLASFQTTRFRTRDRSLSPRIRDWL